MHPPTSNEEYIMYYQNEWQTFYKIDREGYIQQTDDNIIPILEFSLCNTRTEVWHEQLGIKIYVYSDIFIHILKSLHVYMRHNNVHGSVSFKILLLLQYCENKKESMHPACLGIVE